MDSTDKIIPVPDDVRQVTIIESNKSHYPVEPVRYHGKPVGNPKERYVRKSKRERLRHPSGKPMGGV